MTADAEVAEQNARRAAQYAQEAAVAIQRAGSGMRAAAAAATDAGHTSIRGRSDANELINNGQRMDVAEEPRRYLAEAEYSVGDVSRRVEVGSAMLQEVREHLEAARRELRTGRQAVVELSRLPGHQSELVDTLHHRLDGLEEAVHRADRTAGEVAGKLAIAQGNVEPMARQARDGNLQATADTVRTTGTSADRNLHDAQQDLRRLEDDIDLVRPNLSKAEQESIQLHDAIRAATNPTPASQQRAAGSASQPSGNPRPGEPARDNGYSR